MNLEGKRILVTGGTGSLGQTLVLDFHWRDGQAGAHYGFFARRSQTALYAA